MNLALAEFDLRVHIILIYDSWQIDSHFKEPVMRKAFPYDGDIIKGCRRKFPSATNEEGSVVYILINWERQLKFLMMLPMEKLLL